MTVASILKAIPEKQRGEALWLLASILQKNRAEILLDAAEPLGPAQLKLWKKFSAERKKGKPLQYITGLAPFWGREFRVGKGVLIPRPETEMLVELALGLFAEGEAVKALDIGTGSGAIALTLALERPLWRITGTDISPAALRFARANRDRLGASVALKRADLFSPALQKERWDLVVSNPPYLEFKKDKITAEVKKWEPRGALEPSARSRAPLNEKAAWCGENILLGCAASRPRFTALELSARVALLLERRWKKHPGIERIWRAPDLAGKKRFLLVAWKQDAQI